MSHAGLPLQVALIGLGGQQLAISVQHALLQLLPGCSAPDWQFCQDAAQASGASLRWLLAFEEDPQESPQQAIAALQAHQAQRRTLHALDLSYQVLRGTHTQRVAQALHSLSSHLPALTQRLPKIGVASRRPGWRCDECSDPDCEHRSFTALLAQRDASSVQP